MKKSQLTKIIKEEIKSLYEYKANWVVYDVKTKERLPNAGKTWATHKAAEEFADKQKNKAKVADAEFYVYNIQESGIVGGEEKLLSRFEFGPWPINDEGEADPGWAYDEDFIINFKDPDWALERLEGIGFNEFDADIDIVLGSDGKGRLLFFGPTPRDMDSVMNMFKEHDAHDYGWENTYPL